VGDSSGDGSDEPGWSEIIRSERLRIGMTQADLAGRVGLDVETIRKYEKGSRLPPRESLERILAALQVSHSSAHRALVDRGFYHPDFRFAPGYYFSEPELQAFIDGSPWPVFVGNELGEIVAANRIAQALWGVDLAAEAARRGRVRANLLVAMSEPRFAKRLANRDEILRRFVALYKAVPASQSMTESPGALFSQILDAVSGVSPRTVLRVLELWTTTPRITDKVRWTYPVVWREPGFGEMRFQAVVNPASEPEGWGFNDWIPEDAATHAALEAVVRSRAKARHRTERARRPLRPPSVRTSRRRMSS
jgi:transcriptional regulator with XRE-family HTH domain